MNSTKKTPGASVSRRPFSRPVRYAVQLKPDGDQQKAGVSVQSVKRPVAPPAYRPQPVPKVLQTKLSLAQSTRAGQSPRQPVAPPAYRPEAKKIIQPKTISQLRMSPTAPPVYRPEKNRIAQPKMALAASAHTLPSAPAVYRPKPKLVGVQPKMPGSSTLKELRTAPSLYRPQQVQRVLQTKFSSAPPPHLKSGIESPSGTSMHCVNVHCNSSHHAQLNNAQGRDIHGAQGQERLKPTMQMKKANTIQRSTDAYFGVKTEDDFFDLLSENFAKNEEELKERMVQPLVGDPDLIKIYRTEIQTNPNHKTMETEIRKAPLTISWVPDTVFGSSPSRSYYDGVKHEIGVAQSLTGDTAKIASLISLELFTASFGRKTEDDFFDLLSESSAKNEEELKERNVQPLFGDPDLIKIYRTKIQTNPNYKTMEAEIRKAPLTFSWVPDTVFGSSPSRAQYDGAKHEIGVAQSLKGNTAEIVSLISFELFNAKSKPVFSTIWAEYATDTVRMTRSYTGVPMFNTNETRSPNEQLAAAKWIVAVEREEYENVIRLEKAAQAVGNHSKSYDHLKGGAQARWSSFAKYLKDQCDRGHYVNKDPNVQKSSWNGWIFVTEGEKVAKDPLG